MRFILYTDKTVSQCLSALNERMQQKGTKSRPEIDGWIEKSGQFSISVSQPVLGRFPRSTRLNADIQREKGITVIRGSVSDGVNPFWLRVLGVVVGIIALVMVLNNQAMLAVITLIFAAIAYVPLRGDYINSDLLLIEVERTLKANPKPPKNTAS